MSDDELAGSIRLLEQMILIRHFEERVSSLYAEGKIAGLLHLGIGQEAIAVGSCASLSIEDRVFASHRAHAHAIAKGADLRKLFAELAGSVEGYCKGRGGSMHLVAADVGFMTATGIVGGNIPLALGSALAERTTCGHAISLCFFGDGAGQTGSFHESLNLASLWSLPVVFVCENNGYAEFSPLSAHTRIERLSTHAATYGISQTTIDGNDVLAVRAAIAHAVERARAEGCSYFVECLTHRLGGHYLGDPEKYRELLAEEEWQAKDPIARFVRLLTERGILDEGGAILEQLDERCQAAVAAAAEAALVGARPDAASIGSGVFAGGS